MRLSLAFVLATALTLGAEYSTYIGDGYPYSVKGMVTDGFGNTYVTGSRILSFPYIGGLSPDVFITKIDPAGRIVFTKTLAGKGADQANAVAVDHSGAIYVAGTTTSQDFPLNNPLPGTYFSGQSSGFIVKLSADGRSIEYSTYFPGTVNAIATDGRGDLYLTGITKRRDFPTTYGMSAEHLDPYFFTWAFITKISAAGDAVLYSGIIAGRKAPCPLANCRAVGTTTSGDAIAVDSAGNAYIAGNSTATDLPATSASFAATGSGAFVAKINADGKGIGYLSYLSAGYFFLGAGSIPASNVHAISVDESGSAFLAGSTSDPNFPVTPGAFQTSFTPSNARGPFGEPLPTGFLAQLSPDGGRMLWATYLGAPSTSAQTIAVDGGGGIWVAGITSSPGSLTGEGAATGGDFLVAVGSSGETLTYRARYPNGTTAQAIAFDNPSGLIRASGSTGLLRSFDPKRRSLQLFGLSNAAGEDISGRVAHGELISIFGQNLGPSTPLVAMPDESGLLPASLGGVRVSIGGVDLPLLYVSDSQINAIAFVQTYSEPGTITVTSSEGSGSLTIVPVGQQPQVFRSSDGKAAALNQNGSVNSPANPAKPGEIVTVWATSAKSGSGQIARSPNNSCSLCVIEVSKDLPPGHAVPPISILYAGPAPGLTDAITQINFRLPPEVPGGGYPGPFWLGVGGEPFFSDPFSLWVVY